MKREIIIKRTLTKAGVLSLTLAVLTLCLLCCSEKSAYAAPPVFDHPPTPACGSTLSVAPGDTLSFTVQASDPDPEVVALVAFGLPPGATMTPGLPTYGNPVSSTFSWTPTAADLGTTRVITFLAVDSQFPHERTSCTISVKVEEVVCLPPVFDHPPTPPCGSTLSVAPGDTLCFKVQASADPSQTVCLTATGLPVGATMAPGLPTCGNPVSSDFCWTPTAADVGTHSITFTAATDEDETCKVQCTINVEVKEVGKCPHTIGFWKTHPADWPVTSLTLGCETYDQSELLGILNTSSWGDASLILARQLIAAKLSIANGSDPAPVAAVIAHADSLLCGFPGKLPYNVRTFTATGRAMVADSRTLDRYNNGVLTPNCVP